MDGPTDTTPQTAEKLRQMLTDKGIPARSQASELSKILGISFSGASKLLNGTLALSTAQTQTLCDHFDVADCVLAEEEAPAGRSTGPVDALFVIGDTQLPAKLWLGARIPAKSRPPRCVAIEGDEGWEVVEASAAPNVPQYIVVKLELCFAQSVAPTVAVVDDDAALAEGVAEYLTLQGLKATAFSDPQAFIDSLARSTWEGIILDWTLGDWTGQEVMEHIGRSSSASAPLILLTGLLTSAASEEGKLAASVLGERSNAIFMSKPIDNARIAAQLRKMIWAKDSP